MRLPSITARGQITARASLPNLVVGVGEAKRWGDVGPVGQIAGAGASFCRLLAVVDHATADVPLTRRDDFGDHDTCADPGLDGSELLSSRLSLAQVRSTVGEPSIEGGSRRTGEQIDGEVVVASASMTC
jgi:hypothetical protein